MYQSCGFRLLSKLEAQDCIEKDSKQGYFQNVLTKVVEQIQDVQNYCLDALRSLQSRLFAHFVFLTVLKGLFFHFP